MTIIRCTRRLLAELRANPAPEVGNSGSDWHANLLRIASYRCVLFTHDATLFSFFVCRPRQPDFEQLPELFGQGLFKALLRSGFSQGQVGRMLDTSREIRYAKTNNRRVLGTMNNMQQMLARTISSRGGLAAADPDDLRRLLIEKPFKAIGYDPPLKRMRELLATGDEH